ncbi:nucleotidyltransferase domain-containing protein [Rhizobium mayense]|uniref:anti-phage Hailong system nucleotidyltransferase HalB n=1 Tax=Rhizobium mayense TaxID=1312184 RepID=UPI000DDCE8AE
MTITAMLLFGSHARGDEDVYSDTDLLLISQDDQPRHIQKGHLSTSIYPAEDLLKRAENGDLFVCHIVREAKAIYDPLDQLASLQARFLLRASYEQEIQNASDLGWFIIDYGHDNNLTSLLNRRIAWCVRTILIARSAEKRKPVFSAEELSAFARSDDVLKLIKNKDTNRVDPGAMKMLHQFLIEFGKDKFQRGPISYGAYLKRFSDTSNTVALAFIRAEGEAAVADY